MADRSELHLMTVLEAPYESMEQVLREGPQAWLPGFEQEGDRVTAELAAEQSHRRIKRRIEVETGPVQRFAYGVTVRLEWRAARHSELFPELEGHLRLERRQPAGCTLRLDARYVPPGGSVGATVDRALMHRIAESSVQDFLDRVASLLVRGPGDRGRRVGGDA